MAGPPVPFEDGRRDGSLLEGEVFEKVRPESFERGGEATPGGRGALVVFFGEGSGGVFHFVEEIGDFPVIGFEAIHDRRERWIRPPKRGEDIHVLVPVMEMDEAAICQATHPDAPEDAIIFERFDLTRDVSGIGSGLDLFRQRFTHPEVMPNGVMHPLEFLHEMRSGLPGSKIHALPRQTKSFRRVHTKMVYDEGVSAITRKSEKAYTLTP